MDVPFNLYKFVPLIIFQLFSSNEYIQNKGEIKVAHYIIFIENQSFYFPNWKYSAVLSPKYKDVIILQPAEKYKYFAALSAFKYLLMLK